MDWIKSAKQTELVSNNTRRSVSIHRNVSRTWHEQSNDYSKNHRNSVGDGYNKYFHAIKRKLCLILVLSVGASVPANAETVGGVSATASPIANSSGSVTNQAIQVLQGPYITNTYGDGISCQGSTLNVTPFVTGSSSFQKPFEPHYMDPVYDMSDLDEDGLMDNPGDILYHVPTRTAQKDTYNLSIGVSATWSKPLDKEAQELCRKAATKHNALRDQILANRRLEFELTRLTKCGELAQKGIVFHPRSPFYRICADVVLKNPPGVIPPHRHTIPAPSTSSQRVSGSAADLGGPLQTPAQPSSSAE
jgi:hypothetical protein